MLCAKPIVTQQLQLCKVAFVEVLVRLLICCDTECVVIPRGDHVQWGLHPGVLLTGMSWCLCNQASFCSCTSAYFVHSKSAQGKVDVLQPCSPSIGSTRKPHACTCCCDLSQAQLLVLLQSERNTTVLVLSCAGSSLCAYTAVY